MVKKGLTMLLCVLIFAASTIVANQPPKGIKKRTESMTPKKTATKQVSKEVVSKAPTTQTVTKEAKKDIAQEAKNSTNTAQEPTKTELNNQVSNLSKQEIMVIVKYLQSQGANEDQIKEFLKKTPQEELKNIAQQIITQENKPFWKKGVDFGKNMAEKTYNSTKKLITAIPSQFIQGFTMAIIGGITQYYAKKALTHILPLDKDEAKLKDEIKVLKTAAIIQALKTEKLNQNIDALNDFNQNLIETIYQENNN